MKNISFTPNVMQIPALTCSARHVHVASPRQSGKTELAVVWLLREVRRAYNAKKTGDFLFSAPTERILTSSALEVFKRFLVKLDWGIYDPTRREIRLKWGPRIFIRSEQIGDCEGMNLYAAALDEPLTAHWVTQVSARLAVLEGRLLTTRCKDLANPSFELSYY